MSQSHQRTSILTPEEVRNARAAIIGEIAAAEQRLLELQKTCRHVNSRDSDGPMRGDSYFTCYDCGKDTYSNYYRPEHNKDNSLDREKLHADYTHYTGINFPRRFR